MRNRSNSVNPDEGLSSEVAETDARFTLLFDVWLVGRSTLALLDQALEPAGIDAEDFAILSLLQVAGPVTPTELSRWMAAAPTTVSSYVKRFVSSGLIRKVPHPADRRSYLIELSRSGVRMHRRAAGLFLPALERVEAELTTPVSRVSELLIELRRALDAAAGPTD